MSPPDQRPEGRRPTRRLPARGLWLLCALLPAACASDWDDPDWQAKVAACDRSVASLLSTRDLVELERAKFLIGRLDCGIGNRLDGARPALVSRRAFGVEEVGRPEVDAALAVSSVTGASRAAKRPSTRVPAARRPVPRSAFLPRDRRTG
jgi:hypothetical protein